MKCMICNHENFKRLFQKERVPVVRCLNCGLVTALVENHNMSEFEEFYDEQANLTEGYLGQVISGQTPHRNIFLKQLKKIEQYKGPFDKKGKLLDIGCSYGVFLRLAEEHGWTVTGIEISRKESAYARDRLRLNVITGTVEDSHFLDEEFDVITMWHVIEHLTNPRSALIEIHRVLGKDWGWFSLPEHIYYFSPSTLKELLNQTGFKCVSLETYESRIRGYGFYQLTYLLRRFLDIIGGQSLGEKWQKEVIGYQNLRLPNKPVQRRNIFTTVYKALKDKNLFVFLLPILYWTWKLNYGAEMLVFASKR